jgi:tetratricopeptide (TPR) repeat protein
VFRETGDRDGEAHVLSCMGLSEAHLGRYEQAAGNFEQALALSREIGDRDLEADTLDGLGDVLCQTSDAGKARAYHADGDSPQARQHWQEALTRYTAIGAPEADEIRARLAAATDDPTHAT